MTKEAFMEKWGLTEKGGELIDEGGNFVAAVCDECGKVEPSGATVNAGTNQPEYCRCGREAM